MNLESTKLNLRQLRYFCEVIDAGSAKAAANKLFIAPTAISMQLAQLEETLGGQLLDRTNRPMTLTPLGEFVYPKAKELLAASSRLEREARSMAAGKLGWLGIGFTRSVMISVLPEAVRTMQSAFPDVRIDLVEVLTEDQASSLRAGSIHVGVARVIGDFAKEPDLSYTPLFDDPLVVALPMHHALAGQVSVRASDLNAVTYITYPGSARSHFARQVLALLAAAGSTPRIGYEAKEIHTALSLVAAGLGATVVGRSVAMTNRTDIRFLPITDIDAHSRVIIIRKADRAYPISQSFVDILQTLCASSEP